MNDIENLATNCGSVSDDKYNDRTTWEFDKTALKQFAEAYHAEKQREQENETSSLEPVAIVHRGIAYWKGKEQPDDTLLYTTPSDQSKLIESQASEIAEYKKHIAEVEAKNAHEVCELYQARITELQAHINVLREALERINRD